MNDEPKIKVFSQLHPLFKKLALFQKSETLPCLRP